MGLNPLQEKGIPIEDQLVNWSELNVKPINKKSSSPYTRTRIITMNGIEFESILHSHQFARHTDNPEIKAELALLRRADQQQQKMINWLLPGDASPLETTIAYEQVAVDLTAFVARNEPDPYLKQTFDFGLLEDFDHLYRYANLLDLLEGKNAQEITGNYTEIMEGRPTVFEHRYPYDDIRAHYDKHTTDPLSRLHVLTIMAAEQQTMNFYMNVGPTFADPLARALYQEIAMIEEQHVTQYESLLDPLESWFQQEVFHHYNECYLYYSFMQEEEDCRIKDLWERCFRMELEHVQVAASLMRKYEGIEGAEILPKQLPSLTRFQSNKDYVRDVLANQVDLRTMGPTFLPLKELSKDSPYFEYQDTVNAGGWVPSDEVIKEHNAKKGFTIQFLTEGPHPAEAQKKHR